MSRVAPSENDGTDPVQTTVVRSSSGNRVLIIDNDAIAFGRIIRPLLKDGGGLAALKGGSPKVLLALLCHYNGNHLSASDELLAWPEVSTLQALTGLRRSAVYVAIAQLVQVGLVERVHGGGGRHGTVYRIVAPKSEQSVHENGRVRASGADPRRAHSWTGAVQRRARQPSSSSGASLKSKNDLNPTTMETGDEGGRADETEREVVVGLMVNSALKWDPADAAKCAAHPKATPERVRLAIDATTAACARAEKKGKPIGNPTGYCRTLIESGNLVDSTRAQAAQNLDRLTAGKGEADAEDIVARHAERRATEAANASHNQALDRLLKSLPAAELGVHVDAVIRAAQDAVTRKSYERNRRNLFSPAAMFLREALWERLNRPPAPASTRPVRTSGRVTTRAAAPAPAIPAQLPLFSETR